MPVCRLCCPARGRRRMSWMRRPSWRARAGGAGQPGRGEQGESAGRVEVAVARGGGRCGEGLSPLLGVREGAHGWRENWQEVMHRG
jgi:hypothetical protein